MASNNEFKRIGIVGAGNMGTSMAMGFSENGHEVSLWDVKSENVDEAMKMIHEDKNERKEVDGFHDIKEFVDSLGAGRKLFIFSITHGWPADSVLEKIEGQLKPGDIILDGGNEHYKATERRQKHCKEDLKGVQWVGMGVSGGYQSARRGPSMSPGGDKEAVENVLPILKKFSAKHKKTGEPCVDYMGPGGAGHYVKMVHNGIETGILSGTCEAWGILRKDLGLDEDEIGDIFGKWNSEGELRENFLIQISSEICKRKKTPEGDQKGEGVGKGGHVLEDILDKVVQDDDDSEGTFFWTVAEAAERHVAAHTIAASQFFRVASGDRTQRLKAVDELKIPQPQKAKVEDKDAFIEKLRRAVYASFLCSYIQGLELIARGSKDNGWDIDLAKCIKIWRSGCIIESQYILDLFAKPLSSDARIMNMKLIDEVAAELRKQYEPLKEIVMKATEWDAYVPSLSASLEYIKIVGGKDLATQEMEAMKDFFGAHNYDVRGKRGEDPGKAEKGAHHYEWRPA